MHRFEGKVALVTGGNSGIGRATSIAFAREGASVVIAARRENLGEEVVQEITRAGGRAIFIKTDVTIPKDIENLFKQIADIHGKLDYAFNNAGIGGTMNRVGKEALDTWDLIMSTNLRAVWLCMRYEIQQMLKHGNGVIVNTASTAGMRGSPGMAIYSASKHGVIGLTKSAAADYATKNIRINAVCPGPIMTPMVEELFNNRPGMREAYLDTILMGRFGTPEEISGAVLWLCSEDASFMTGYCVPIGGGQTVIP